MTLTLVPPSSVAREWRGGVWVKISISLIVAGVASLVTAGIVGVNWYYGLHTLSTEGVGRSASVSMTVGTTHVIDERVSTHAGYRYSVNVRSVSVRVSVNLAEATIVVETCPDGGGTPGAVAALGSATCASPVPFRPGLISLGSEQLLVSVHANKPGRVVIDGVDVSYQAGVRHSTQHVGPSVTITVTA